MKRGPYRIHPAYAYGPPHGTVTMDYGHSTKEKAEHAFARLMRRILNTLIHEPTTVTMHGPGVKYRRHFDPPYVIRELKSGLMNIRAQRKSITNAVRRARGACTSPSAETSEKAS